MDGTVAAPRVVETHISTVLLLGDRALKFPKPIATDFLDQSTPEKRRAACERELACNRRLSPDVYLGIGDVREGDTVVDSFLVMRRLPDEARLSALVDSPRFADAVRDTVRTVAAFHSREPATDFAASLATRDATHDLWFAKNLVPMRQFAGAPLDPVVLDEIEALAAAYLAGRDELFQRRIADGCARDGHGDLLADDIFILPDGPRILDGLAFDDALRSGDVLLDIAFLAMDLERIAGPEIVERVLHCYGEFGNEHHPRSLADFYIAYRALVRAKVSCWRAAQGDVAAARTAEERLAQCVEHLRRAVPRLVLVGGAPGTGKSTVAGMLADADDLIVLSTDELRKDLAGTERTAPLGGSAYTLDARASVYAVLLSQARSLLELGESVVLDATWADAGVRAAAVETGRSAHARVVELRCVLAPDVAAARVQLRSDAGGSASDATPELALRFAAGFAPWPDAIEIDTSRPPREVCTQACAAVAPSAPPVGAVGAVSERGGPAGP